MSPLRNPRHERLAQALADGKSQEAAYIEAGFRPTGARANASKLVRRNDSISRRVQDLLDERRRVADAAVSAAVVATGMDRTKVDRLLIEIVERCMEPRPILGADGQPVLMPMPDGSRAPAYTFDARGAIAALRLLGLERGMFRQRGMEGERDLFKDLPAEAVTQIRDALISIGQQFHI